MVHALVSHDKSSNKDLNLEILTRKTTRSFDRESESKIKREKNWQKSGNLIKSRNLERKRGGSYLHG